MNFIDNINIDKYNEFVKNNINCNIFQSPQWVDIKSDFWEYKRVALEDNEGNIVATAQILTRSGLWYLPRGPILDYTNFHLLGTFLDELKKYAKKCKAKMLKIDIPEPLKKAKIEDFKLASEDDKKENILNTFKKLKFKHQGFSLKMEDTIQPRFEAVTELGELYFDSLPKHTKRLLKDVEKRFVEVKQSDREGLDDLMFALACTEERKNIKLRNREYFEKLFDLYGANCVIFTAYLNVKNALEKCKYTEEQLLEEISNLTEKMHKKKKTLEDMLNGTRNLISFFSDIKESSNQDKHILCSAISVKYGNSSEMLYAGMNDKFSKIPAQYKVYVDTMLNFSSLGVKETSMGGVEGSLDDGLLKFKSHFNPNIVEHYGEFDYAISKTYKLMYDYGLPLRRKVLKLIKR